MNIKIIAIGSIKDTNLSLLINKYFIRIKKYCKIELVELKEVNVKEDNRKVKLETEELINKINSFKDYEKVLLNLNSKNISSLEFKNIIANNKDYKNGKIIFIIGGSNGFSDLIKNKINYEISFGNITFPHQLFRLILCEQIYRAFKIMNNERYHK